MNDRISQLQAAVVDAGNYPESVVVCDWGVGLRRLSDALIGECITLALYGRRRPAQDNIRSSDILTRQQLAALYPGYTGPVLDDDGSIYYLNPQPDV